MGQATAGAKDRLEVLRAGVSALATRLYELADDPVAGQLTDAPLGGATAAAAADAKPALDRLWLRFPALRDGVERLGDIGRDDRLAAALDEPIDDGTGTALAIEALLAQVEADLATVTTTLGRLRAVWDSVLPAVADARRELGTLEERAAGLGAADDGTLRAARAALGRAEDLVASDPLVVDLDILDAAMDNARDVITALARRRDAVSQRLAAGEAVIDEIRTATARAHDDLVAAREKIADPVGLLDPPDPDAVDGDDRAVGPWLERIGAALRRGDWRAAEAGLDRWEPVAAGHLDNARRAAAANAAPLARRAELRGLLDGLRAKAAARGLVEDPDLSRLHDDARAVLYVAPCPLDEAAARVRAYGDALNDQLAQPAAAAVPPPSDEEPS